MFLIYRYTAPDGRVYIGCTARTLEARAGDNGIRYKDATKVWVQRFIDGILEKKIVTPEESVEYLTLGWPSGMGPRLK